MSTPMVVAPATKTSFKAKMTMMLVNPGKMWTTNGSIQQIKGAVAEGSITGDISGSATVTEDEALNLKTGEGCVHGKVVMTTAGGTFEGSFAGFVTGFVNVWGKAVGHGTGVFEGQKIMVSYKGHSEMIDGVPTTIADVEGIILSPHG